MRKSLILPPGLLGPGIAAAHTLDGDAALPEQIAHQLSGAHHLPALLLTIFGTVLLIAALIRRSPRKRNNPNS